MAKVDTRRLSVKEQESLRFRVIEELKKGISQSAAARLFGVARQSVNRWDCRCRKKGLNVLKSQPRGRPQILSLKSHQAATLVRLITDRCPDQLKMPFVLWTREAVQELIAGKFGISLSVWTVGRYLQKWGFSPQKPLRRAYEQNPGEVRQWLKKEYPSIRVRAKPEGATIFWGDEMGMRSDHHAGRCWGRRGQTPVILGTGQRFRCNMISAITNRGKLAFMIFEKRFTTPVFIGFLRRLIRHSKRNVFLIVDSHPVHLSASAQRWVKQHRPRLSIFFLPSYSPDLNPDELLNQDVKTNAVGRKRLRNKEDLLKNVRRYLWSTQRRPKKIKNYFRESHVLYASA